MRTLHSNYRSQEVPVAVLMLVFGIAATMIINLLTQFHETNISVVPNHQIFFKDPVWYLDDIFGPAGFIAAAACLVSLRKIYQLSFRECWPIWVLVGVFFLRGLGDTLDVHWVIAESMLLEENAKSFHSNASKIMSSILLMVGFIYGRHHFDESAERMLALVVFLYLVDQLVLSIQFDFAGFQFHLFEECLECVCALILLFGVTLYPLLLRPKPRKSI